MANTFNCPKCGAPLDYDGGPDLTITCPFCKNSVIVPEELRVGSGKSGSFNLSQLAGQSLRLAEMARLIRAGEKIGAIKIYREVFGGGLKEAKDAVEALAAGSPIVVSAQTANASPHQSAQLDEIIRLVRAGDKIGAIKVYREMTGLGLKESKDIIDALDTAKPIVITTPTPSIANKKSARGISAKVWIGIFLVVFFFCPFAFFAPFLPFASIFGTMEKSPTSTPIARTPTRIATPTIAPTLTRVPTPSPTPALMNLALKFGGSGSGPGLFTDARSIALHPNGNIYIADYTGGRVQTFDATGNFLSVGLVEGKLPVFALASDRRGRVYVAQGGAILRFDGATYKALGTLEYTGGNRFGTVATTPDGGILAMWYEQREGLITSIQGHREDLVRFDAEGKVVQVWRGPISTQSGNAELDARIAVDGLGNMFILASNAEQIVFAFSPDGKFINRFGSRGNAPGQLSSPRAIAVDNQGRVHVADSRGVHVFAPDGRYIDMYPVDSGVSAMTFDDKNNLWVVARTQVLKYMAGQK